MFTKAARIKGRAATTTLKALPTCTWMIESKPALPKRTDDRSDQDRPLAQGMRNHPARRAAAVGGVLLGEGKFSGFDGHRRELLVYHQIIDVIICNHENSNTLPDLIPASKRHCFG